MRARVRGRGMGFSGLVGGTRCHLACVIGAGVVVPDDIERLVLAFAFDHDHAAQEKVAGIGDDGGTAWRDAAFGEEKDDSGQEIVDLLWGLEPCGFVAEEVGGNVGDVGWSIHR